MGGVTVAPTISSAFFDAQSSPVASVPSIVTREPSTRAEGIVCTGLGSEGFGCRFSSGDRLPLLSFLVGVAWGALSMSGAENEEHFGIMDFMFHCKDFQAWSQRTMTAYDTGAQSVPPFASNEKCSIDDSVLFLMSCLLPAGHAHFVSLR